MTFLEKVILRVPLSSIYFFFETCLMLDMYIVPQKTDSRACRSCSISRIVSDERIALQAGQPSIIRHPSSLRFCAISLPRRTHSYRSAHSRHTVGGYIAAGGESIFIRPEIDRPRNESPMGRACGLQRRDAPPSSMRLHQPICIGECAACDKRVLSAHVIVRIISREKDKWLPTSLSRSHFFSRDFFYEKGKLLLGKKLLWKFSFNINFMACVKRQIEEFSLFFLFAT